MPKLETKQGLGSYFMQEHEEKALEFCAYPTLGTRRKQGFDINKELGNYVNAYIHVHMLYIGTNTKTHPQHIYLNLSSLLPSDRQGLGVSVCFPV